MGVGRGARKINGVADLLHETPGGGSRVPRAPPWTAGSPGGTAPRFVLTGGFPDAFFKQPHG